MSKKKRAIPSGKPISQKPASKDIANKKPFNFDWIILGIILLFVFFVRVRLMDMPLERDEGEFGYTAQVILDGDSPYESAYNKKLPGVSYFYAVFIAILGPTISAIRISLLFVNLLCIILIYLIGKRMLGGLLALSAAGIYAILTVDSGVLGNAAHATQYVNLFALAGIWFLYKNLGYQSAKNYFLAGLMMGLAFIMKQQAVFFIFFLMAIWVYKSWQNRSDFAAQIKYGVMAAAGIFLPYLLIVLLVLIQGVWDKFWFWTVTYSSAYASETTLASAMAIIKIMLPIVVSEFWLLWIWCIAGAGLIFIVPIKKDLRFFLLSLFIASFLTVLPGLVFRNHYFIPFIPALALMGGITVITISKLLQNSPVKKYASLVAIVPLCALILLGISSKKDYFFEMDTDKLSRKIYGLNPFQESEKVADFIKKNTKKGDKIAVLGSEAQIYYLADRRASTGYIYTYGLVDNQFYNLQMQKEMIAEIEANQPEMLVMVKVQSSWGMRPNSEQHLFNWFGKYASEGYNLVGAVDMFNNNIVYKWGVEASKYTVQSDYFIHVLKKR